jgi:hypothetical protein
MGYKANLRNNDSLNENVLYYIKHDEKYEQIRMSKNQLLDTPREYSS